MMVRRGDYCEKDEGFDGDGQAVIKRTKLSNELNPQVTCMKFCKESSPLGLKLSKTPSLINEIEMKLSQARKSDQDSRTKMDYEKLKASNFGAKLLIIGTWKRVSKYEGDLIAKCYFAKKKIVWEILEGPLKRKIEIQWSDIIGIRGVILDDKPGVLEIELNNPPSYFQETNPQPRKHTLWHQAADFTGGQAPMYRRHHLVFPPGVLDKHYEKLLQCDQRLFELSKKSFPTLANPTFCQRHYSQLPEYSCNNIVNGNQDSSYISPQLQYHAPNFYQNGMVNQPHDLQAHNFNAMPNLPHGVIDSTSQVQQLPTTTMLWNLQAANSIMGANGNPDQLAAAYQDQSHLMMNSGEESPGMSTGLAEFEHLCTNENALFMAKQLALDSLLHELNANSTDHHHSSPVPNYLLSQNQENFGVPNAIWLPTHQNSAVSMTINPSNDHQTVYPFVVAEPPTPHDFEELDASQNICRSWDVQN